MSQGPLSMSTATRVVYAKVRDRLTEAEIHHRNRLSHDNVLFLLPLEHDDNATFHRQLRRIMECNMMFSDTELEQYLAIRPLSESPVAANTVTFYLRSWTLSPATLQSILAIWAQDETDYPKAEVWQEYSTKYPAKPFHIRYVGMCVGKSPFSRQREDAASRGAFMRKFLDTLYAVDRDAYTNIRIFEFGRATSTIDACPVTKRDMVEQAAIAFFGCDKLLNVQIGGYHFSYDPDMQRFQEFQGYNLRFFSLAQQFLDGSSDHPYSSLAEWVGVVQRLSHRVETQGSSQGYPISDALAHVILEQAVPTTVLGHTILVIVGIEPTFRCFTKLEGFFDGSRAGQLTKSILVRQQAWAEGKMDWSLDDFDRKMFPFVDLYPWLNTVNTRDSALEQLCTYMTAVQPLVTVASSQPATSALFANLFHHHGFTPCAGESFLHIVGLPRVCYFPGQQWLDAESEESTPPPDKATIVVPHIHPGNERYGTRSSALLELLDLTWMITLLVSEIAIQCAAMHRSAPRGVIIEQVWQQVDPHSSFLDPRLVEVYIQLLQVKERLQQFYQDQRQQQGPASREANRDALTTAACARIALYGRAQGEQGSLERQVQVSRLWRMHYPALHIHIPRSDRQGWLDWACSIDQGTAFFASALRRAGMLSTHPLWNALRRFVPLGDTAEPSWLEDEQNLTTAALAWGAEMKLHLPKDHFARDHQVERIAARWNGGDAQLYHFTEVQHGREVSVSRTHPIFIRWLDGITERMIKLPLRNKQHILPDGASRHIFLLQFLCNGIGLLHKETLIPVLVPVDTASIDMTEALVSLDEIKSDPHLWQLWFQERRRLGDDSAVFPRQSIASSSSITTSDEPPSPTPSTSKRRRVNDGSAVALSGDAGRGVINALNKPHVLATFARPFHENDALYVLDQFVDQHFPSGGSVHMGNSLLATVMPLQLSSFQSLFREFLNDHYENHPFYSKWISMITDEEIGKQAKHLLANIAFVRPGTAKRPKNFMTWRGGTCRQCMIVDIVQKAQ